MSFFVISCLQEKKVNKFDESLKVVKIDTLVVYNDILNNLVDSHLYNKYLGRKWELLAISLYKKRIDSVTYLNKVNSLKKNIIENDSLKGTLYVNDVFNGYERDIKFLKFPDEFDIEEIKIQIGKKNYLSVDSLKSDFIKLKGVSTKNKDTLKVFEVGMLSLSKVVFNKDNTLGMLYFEFICGAKCGEGSIILIKKTNNKWYVEKEYTLWEI
jgi:hypothetical protein